MKISYKSPLTKIASITLLCFLFSNIPTFSQNYLFDVDVIGIEDGLPHRNTNNIVQDRDGFIWVSTVGAVSRYDGYNFKTYNYAFLNISESSTAYLAVDKANLLWYCEGFNTSVLYSGVIDTRTDTVYPMEEISEGRFTSRDVLYINNSKTNSEDIFITTQAGVIYKYNGNFEEIYRFPHRLSSVALCEAIPSGGYWIIYDNYAINVEHKKAVKTVELTNEKMLAEGIMRIVTVAPDLILELYGHFVNKYWKLEKDTIIPFTIKGHSPETLKGLFQQHKDYNIYTTKDSLFIRNKNGNTLYTSDAFEFFLFGQNQGYLPPLLDWQNILWVPTESGLLKITARKTPFEILESGNSIRGIFKDDERIWIGGYSRNVVRNTATGAAEAFFPFPVVGSSFYKDDRGHLWISTSGRNLKEYIPDKDSYTEYLFNFNKLFYLLFQNSITKTYWAGSNNGVFRFDPVRGKATPFALPIASKNLHIRQFYQNTQGIWIVTNKGIFLMDAEKETIIKHYTTANGFPVDNINHVYEDATGIFWIGTKGGGLIRWKLSDNTFTQYTQKDGLSNNNIYAVYEDDYQTLWLPSDYGLMAFDKNTLTTKIYLPKNGIAHEEFNTYAHFKDKDGTLYFGGLNGITKFHPKDLQREYNTVLPLYVTQVRILEKDAEKFTDKTSDYLDIKKINLNSNDRILELELTLLDYQNSAKNQYAYKLTNHHNQWIYTNNNTLSIINPPYGRYDLIIKARGASGSWSDNVLTIPIYVPLPFYFQWWFILSIIIVIVVTVIVAIRWRIRNLKKDREYLEKEVQKRTFQIKKDKQTIEKQTEELKILDKAKTRFFTNITHEFRTPLTLILGPAEQVTANDAPEVLMAKMQSIKGNSKHLLGLINQLLDISKLESGQMPVKASTVDIVDYTKKLVQAFKSSAHEKEQELIFNSTLEQWKTRVDVEKFNKILYNLLSNALKYTQEKGIIQLSLSKKEDHDKEYIKIRVEDTGMGIAAAMQLHIFDRFYQADDSSTRENEGTGIGLALVKELVEFQNGKITVESEVEKGSVFTVTLPVLPSALYADTSFEVFKPKFPVVTDKMGSALPKKQYGNTSEENKLALLIIEDNAQMRSYISSCIDLSVYHISEAEDGEVGIEKARKIVPDLIILDVMMPKKDGFEVTRAIRSDIATSHIPLILLTAKASQENRLEGLERGADAYLTKPFSPQELILRIKKLIELRQLIQKHYQSPRPQKTYIGFRKEDGFINELKDYITEHISEPDLNGEFIGQHFAMSRMQLHRKLKAILNSDTSSYIRSVRLDRALRLLKEKQLNITEVAYETGFSSPDHFSRSFKKAYGKSPSKI